MPRTSAPGSRIRGRATPPRRTACGPTGRRSPGRRKDDPRGVRLVFTAVDRPGGNPRPDGAFGSADLLRIHVGAQRVMYEVGDRHIRVTVIHLGRVR
ncbi:hypothetical protein FB563_4612 [Streptomyces puniciscabiei]|uniref:mRNA interferase RelE/StbE n=1 Tax=Streptomyces puniciscabiei TaxID=164348 RepID=A0A542UKD4_9ACTN|nr:hypothetical protein FB563_4612 [Streptomyces puniciscabiei]